MGNIALSVSKTVQVKLEPDKVKDIIGKHVKDTMGIDVSNFLMSGDRLGTLFFESKTEE